MWRNFSHSSFVQSRKWLIVALPAWVLVSFALAQMVTLGVITGLNALQVPFGAMNQAVLSTLISVVVYVLSIVITIGVPWWIKKYRTSREDIGLTSWPSWTDIFLAPAGFIIYFILSAVLALIAANITTINLDQVQETGFDTISQNYEYILAFLSLVIIAPIAEEVLFRGYLFGKLRKHAPLWIAILITSLLFAVVHGAWNVGIDVFALSIILCLLRVWSKSLWAPILLHMIKNGIAFYFLFINPYLLTTLGG